MPSRRPFRTIVQLVAAAHLALVPAVFPAVAADTDGTSPYFRLKFGASKADVGLTVQDGPSGTYRIRQGMGPSVGRRATASLSPVTWSYGGDVPPGMAVDAGSGALTGVATKTGTFSGQLVATYVPTDGSKTLTGTGSVFTFEVLGPPALSYAPPQMVPSGVNVPIFPKIDSVISGTFSSVSTLPPGLSLDASSGVLWVRPGARGSYPNLAVRVVDSDGQSATSSPFTVNVATGTATVFATDGKVGVVGVPFESRVTTTGLVAPVTYSVPSGKLPPGLGFCQSQSTICGKPTTPGTFAGIYLGASDGNNLTAISQTPVTITVEVARISYTDQVVSVGKTFTARPATSHLEGATYAFKTTPPAGVVIDPATGVVSGTVSVSGTTGIQVVATTADITVLSNPFNLTGKVDAFSVAAPSEFIQAHVGYPVRQPFRSNPAISGLAWAVTAGKLPDGLTLNPSTGLVSGSGTTPVNVDDVVITATSGGQSASTDKLHYDIKALPTVVAATAYPTMQGQAAAIAVTAKNVIGTPTFTTDATKLPPGMSLDSTGAFSGTPTQTGTYDGIVVTVSDGFDGATGRSVPFTIEVTPSDGSMTVAGVPDSYRVRQNKTLTTQAPTVSGTTSALTWGLSPDSAPLPTGLTVDPTTGVISGTPTSPGDTANVILQASETTTKSGLLDFFARRIRLASNDPSFVVAQAAPKAPRKAFTRKFTITVGPPLKVANVQPTYKLKIATPIEVAPRASGVMGATTWRLAGGTLPNAATFDAGTGRIAGPALTAGRIPGGSTGDLTIQAVDSFDGEVASSQPFSLTIDPGVVVLGPSDLKATVNKDFTSGNVFTASNGVGKLTWQVIGNLPDGFVLDRDTGVISGRSAAPSITLDLRMQATQVDGATGVSPPFTFTVQGGMQVAYPSYVIAHINQPMPPILPTVSGAQGSVTWAIASGSLPPGVTMNPATGALIGSPTAGGLWYDIMIGAKDGTGANAVSPPVTLDINNGLVFSTGVQAPVGRKGSKFTSNTPRVTNASGDVHFRLVRPIFDWSVDPNTGVVTGTNQGGSADRDWLVAYDSTGASISHDTIYPNAYANVSWYCSYQTVCPFDGLTNTMSYAGTGYIFDKIGTLSYEKVGTWPDWLTLDTKTGVASGIPPAAGTYAFETRLTDTFDGKTSNRVRSLVVKDGQPSGRSFSGYYPGGSTICAVAGQDFDTGPGNLVGFGTGTTVRVNNAYGGDSRLPAWMNVDPATGRISGTVPDDQTGDFYMPLREIASDPAIANDYYEWDGNRYISSFANLTLDAPPNMAAGYQVTSTYDYFFRENQFVTRGARDNKRVFITGGQAPPGMQITMDGGGSFVGSPSTPGDYTMTVTLTATQCDGRVISTSKDFVVKVKGPSNPYVINSQTVYARVGIPFRGPGSTIGNPAPAGMGWNFNLRNGNPPGDLGVKWSGGTDGFLYGTPTRTYNDTIRWEASGMWCCGYYAIGNYSRFVVTPGPAITMTDVSIPKGIAAQVLTNSSGFSGPVGWTSSGTLPPGTSVDPGTGAIVGVPTAVGTYGPITVTGTEKVLPTVGPDDPVPAYPSATSNTFKVTVVNGPYIDNYADQSRKLGAPFDVRPRANAFAGTVRWQLVGETPDGVAFDAGTGAISGAGSAYGVHQVQLVAIDSTGVTAFSDIFKLTITDQAGKVPPSGDVTWTWDKQVCIYGCSEAGGCQGRQLQACSGPDCPGPVRGCDAPFKGGDTSFPVGSTATDCPFPTFVPNQAFCPQDTMTVDPGPDGGGGDVQQGKWYYWGWYLQTKHTNGFVVYHNQLKCYVGASQVDASQCGTPPTSIGSCVVNGYGAGNCGSGVPFTGSQIQTRYVSDTSSFFD